LQAAQAMTARRKSPPSAKAGSWSTVASVNVNIVAHQWHFTRGARPCCVNQR
jgi:hypothetical protein